MTVKYKTDEIKTRHIIRSASCDFCGEKLSVEFNDRGYVYSQANHADRGTGYDACEPCLLTVRESISGMLHSE